MNRVIVGPVNKVMILVAAVAGEREFYRVADVLAVIPSLYSKLLYTDTVFMSSPYR